MLSNFVLTNLSFGSLREQVCNRKTRLMQLKPKALQVDTISFKERKKAKKTDFLKLKNLNNPKYPFENQLSELRNAVKWNDSHLTMFLGCPNDKLQDYTTGIVNFINYDKELSEHYKLITIDIADVINDLKKQNLSTQRNSVQGKIIPKLADILNDSANNNVAIVLKNFQLLPENKDLTARDTLMNADQSAGHLWHQEMIFSQKYPNEGYKKMLVITAYDTSSNEIKAVKNAELNATLGNQMAVAHFRLD